MEGWGGRFASHESALAPSTTTAGGEAGTRRAKDQENPFPSSYVFHDEE